ncbi:cytochrome P450 3A41-like [Dermacentor albipictus]|uniref:cytochrome P450 3A41-like n=1 Tax=Dermacentor albipictus TaxID=60249 RepID=UPI0038FC815C
MIRNYSRHGRLYGSFQGGVPTLVVGDTEILREVLVAKFKNFSDRSESQRIGGPVWRKSMLNLSGEEWKKARSVFTPAITTSKLKLIVLKVTTIAERVVSRIEAAAVENKSVNISDRLVDHASLDTAAALNYSVDLDSEKDKDHPLVKSLSAIFINKAGWKAVMLFLMPRLFKVLQPNYPPKANVDIFKAFVSHLIQERESKKKKEDDFLQLFTDADYEWESAEDRKEKREKSGQKRRMTLEEITGHGILFFIGGVEGNTMAVTMTAYFLALHPHFQDRVIAEIDRVVSEHGITYEALQQMPFLEACVKEALRLETHDAIYLRMCTEETTVAGIRFKPGMCVDIPVAAIHHDAEYFPEPEKFNPERFLPENKDSVRPFTYMPFGVGPRNCVAMRLGMLQAKALLACMFRRVRLERCPETMRQLQRCTYKRELVCLESSETYITMLTTFVAFFALAATLLFWWLRRTFTFWKDKGIAHLSFSQYMRFLYDLYTKPVNKVIISSYTHYGRVYGSYQGIAPTLVVGDPDILREVMVTKFKNFPDRSLAQSVGTEVWKKSIMNVSGEEWKKARTIFTPALTATRLKTILKKAKSVLRKMTSRVKDAAAQNKPVDSSGLATHTALDITAALNYSIDIDSENDTNHPILKSLEGIYMNAGGWRAVMLFLMPSLCKILKPDYPPKSSTDLFKAFVSLLIEDRKSKNKVEDDFLQIFMDADYSWEDNSQKKPENATASKMSLEEITAQGLVFFVAGVETVSTALSTTAYYLALNPECQDRVIAEVDKALSEGEVTYDSLQEMPYLEACFKEALRLCTPDSITMRLCKEETTVAGIHFKPGMSVDIPLAGIHHDPEYFPEPENFNPDRFMPENKDAIRPFTYLPFGAGPRNCVGMRLAMIQAKTTLASLLQHVRFETCPETMIPLKLKPAQVSPFFDGPLFLRPVTRQPSANNVSG